MARKETLSCLEKTDLLNQAAASIETLLHWGRKYEEAGLVFDAVEFYEKANEREALDRLLKNALNEGDAFLFKRVSRALKFEPSREEWLELAKKAQELGKYTFAVQAYRQGGEEDMAAQVAHSAAA